MNYARIDALLDRQCLTYAEIGRRVGLSRERIRQIDLKKHNRRGTQRKDMCILPPPEPPSCEFVSECERQGMAVRADVRPDGYVPRSSSVFVNGWRVGIRFAHEERDGVFRFGPSRMVQCIDFLVYQIPNGDYLIVPMTGQPMPIGRFIANPKRKLRSTGNWQIYRNRWDSLATPKTP